jgi:hypothetical protein
VQFEIMICENNIQYIAVAHLFSFLCCVLFVFVLCLVAQCYQFLWIVHSGLPLRFSPWVRSPWVRSP